MPKPKTGARNKKPIQQQEQQPDEFIVNIEKILDSQPPNTTESVQVSASGNITKERPSIFHYIGISVGGYQYSKNGDDSSEMWKYVAFMKNYLGLSIHSYYKSIKENEDVALGYYIEEHQKYFIDNGNLFQKFLLVSSCFLCCAILLFQKVQHWTEILKMSGRGDNSDFVNHMIQQFSILSRRMMQNQLRTKLDMLSIYHQIPWLAVETVFENSDLSEFCSTKISRLAMSCFDDLYPKAAKDISKVQEDTFPSGGFKHLLHIFHWTRTPHCNYVKPQSEHVQPAKSFGEFYIPSATDLVRSATKFRKMAGSCVTVYHDKGLTGRMQITTLHLFEYSCNLFSELLQFEQNFKECGLPITAYIACLESLLQTDADVKLLQKHGIVKNTLKHEEKVLNFVSELRKTLSEEQNACIPEDLNILSEEVIRHHGRRINKGYYLFKRQYYPNKCVIFSFMAGLLLFALTFVQTLYTAKSYYKM